MRYLNLVTAMGKEHVTKTDLSRILNIHLNTVTAKINCDTSSENAKYQIGFTFLEAIIVRDTLFKSYDFQWLFSMDMGDHEKEAS